MLKEESFFMGSIIGKYSFKGELLIKLDTDNPDSFLNLETVFIDKNEGLIPYFIEKLTLHKSKLLRVKFEDVNNEDDAKSLLNKDLYLPIDKLPKLEKDKFYYHEVSGFKAYDQFGKEIGVIKTLNDNGPQALFVIDSNDTEILIPVHDDFIKKLDRHGKKILLKIPDGLLEIFK